MLMLALFPQITAPAAPLGTFASTMGYARLATARSFGEVARIQRGVHRSVLYTACVSDSKGWQGQV